LGRYGRRVEENAFRLLKYGLIHVVASDGHGVRSIPPKLSDAVRIISSVIGERNALMMVQANPQAILSDQEVPYFPGPEDPKTNQKSLRIKIPKIFSGRIGRKQ
jgi:protein-tyrosine phosphatase